MMGLLVFKEWLKEFYGRNALYVRPIIKFALCLAIFLILNQNIGFMAKLKSPLLVIGLSLVCSVLPYGVISLITAVFALIHINSVSFEIAILTAAFMVIIMLLYYGFQPGDSILLIATPVLFFLKVPYVVPLLAGLSCGLMSVIPVSCGVCLYYILLYVKQNAGVLTGDAAVDITQKYGQIIKNIMSNQTMLVMMAAFAVGILVVCIIRNTSVDYAWTIAIIVGTIAQLVVIFIGDFLFNITVPMISLIVGMFISVTIAAVYNFFVLAVDYTRTEYLQYEDDDYYYYVKAVPKITVSAPDVRVQQINARKAGHQVRR
ncbi:ABC transporter permease [Clostridium sp. AM58-1XD]|uniref:ABC transporter permease n=1 Tax=Clostridium sp. AM58-1XD TaxID=2292307 RepID=UPI000E5018DB|nr:ABC transporter permease [Clostridium sp. AM58-1XD]RGY96098.1 ABC transporter permease [Clostridium sp. AM58-1XD]